MDALGNGLLADPIRLTVSPQVVAQGLAWTVEPFGKAGQFGWVERLLDKLIDLQVRWSQDEMIAVHLAAGIADAVRCFEKLDQKSQAIENLIQKVIQLGKAFPEHEELAVQEAATLRTGIVRSLERNEHVETSARLKASRMVCSRRPADVRVAREHAASVLCVLIGRDDLGSAEIRGFGRRGSGASRTFCRGTRPHKVLCHRAESGQQ